MAPNCATTSSFKASRTRASGRAPPLALSNFGPAADLPGNLRGGVPACLSAVDGFQLVFDPQVADGQTVAGVLSIDNVRVLR